MLPEPVLADLSARIVELGWITDLWVAGSLASGDYRPDVSDFDLVALVDGQLGAQRRSTLLRLHQEMDSTYPSAKLGCAYMRASARDDLAAVHPTWTHGRLVDREVSGIVRAELVRFGYELIGRRPADVLPAMTDNDIRDAGRAELIGYWTDAARRPWWWLDPELVDLGLTSMARGRHAITYGSLVTKSDALERCAAPAWLRDQMRARRAGAAVSSPRIRAGWIAWRDACRATAEARRPPRRNAG